MFCIDDFEQKRNRKYEIIEHIYSGGDVNTWLRYRYRSGTPSQTILMYAVKEGWYDLVVWLFDQGADAWIRDKYDNLPCDYYPMYLGICQSVDTKSSKYMLDMCKKSRVPPLVTLCIRVSMGLPSSEIRLLPQHFYIATSRYTEPDINSAPREIIVEQPYDDDDY